MTRLLRAATISIYLCLGVDGVSFAESTSVVNIAPFRLDFSKARSDNTVKIFTEKKNHPTAFLVDTPPRIVIDLPAPNGKKNKTSKENIIAIDDNPCIRQVRMAVHGDKSRLVLDLHQQTGEKVCQEVIADEHDGVIQISFTLIGKSAFHEALETNSVSTSVPTQASKVVPPLAPTAIPTVIPTAIPTNTVAPATSVPTVTASPSTTLISAEIDIIDLPEPTPTAAATATMPNIVTPISSNPPEPTTVVGKPMLSAIDFIHDGSTNQIKIVLSERVAFKLIREDTRKYKISISNIGLTNRGLLLPQFPPNEVAGFTMARAGETASGLEILIGVDDGMKAVAVNIDQSIVVTAEPAGF